MSKKILVADDSVVIQKSIGITFAQEDFEVKFVSNGEDALKTCTSFMPDIIIADVTMPKMGGADLTKRIYENPMLRNIPILLLAGARDQMSSAQAQSIGAKDVVIKPFDSNELIQKVHHYMGAPASAPSSSTIAPTASAPEPVFGDMNEIQLDVDTSMDEDSETKDFVPFSMDDDQSIDLAEMPADALDATMGKEPGKDVFATEVQYKETERTIIEPADNTPDLSDFSMDSTPDLSSEDLAPEPVVPIMDQMDIDDDEKPAPSTPSFTLTDQQIEKIVTQAFQSVIERIAWEVVPDMAERIIKEEIQRLTGEKDRS